MDALIARVQRLIDAHAESDDPLAWSVKASFLADIPAIAALAAIAARGANRQILIVRDLRAPRELVYAAWTTPDLVRRWWGGKRGELTIVEIDLRVGGKWRYVVEQDGRHSDFHGEYREIVAGERIVATQVDEVTHGESLSTVTFSDTNDGGTRLAVLMHLTSSHARDAAIESGIQAVLEDQMTLLEQVAASVPQ